MSLLQFQVLHVSICLFNSALENEYSQNQSNFNKNNTEITQWIPVKNKLLLINVAAS